jgi:beta-galactosidase
VLFDDWSGRDLRALILRDRNHPSVIAWSIGNEIVEQGSPEGTESGKALTAIVHATDPTRPSTIGCNNTQAGFNGFQKAVDVFGYNYRGENFPKFHKENPNQPVYGSETSSAISSRGFYLFPVGNKKDGGRKDFQMSSYDLYAPSWGRIPDEEFRYQDASPAFTGEFVWTGFDYLGEPTPYSTDDTNLLNLASNPEALEKLRQEQEAAGKKPMPSRSSYFGIIDLAGFPKDRYYLYQSHWRKDFPMAHLLPHWNWPDRAGQVTPVHLYTSGDEAELFLNGKSLGRKKKGQNEYRLRWDDVVYQPGELKAVAYKNGRQWATDVVKTTGAPKALHLSADRSSLTTSGADLAYVTLKVNDDKGLAVPTANPTVRFEVTGPAELVATDNGDATDHTVFSSPERKVFNGLALAIVRPQTGNGGEITVKATAEGLQPATLTLKAAPAK